MPHHLQRNRRSCLHQRRNLICSHYTSVKVFLKGSWISSAEWSMWPLPARTIPWLSLLSCYSHPLGCNSLIDEIIKRHFTHKVNSRQIQYLLLSVWLVNFMWQYKTLSFGSQLAEVMHTGTSSFRLSREGMEKSWKENLCEWSVCIWTDSGHCCHSRICFFFLLYNLLFCACSASALLCFAHYRARWVY